MAHVEAGRGDYPDMVALTLTHNDDVITEYCTPEQARKLAVNLMSVAGRADRVGTRPDWP